MPTKSNNIGGRGGARPGAGRKKTAVREKAENGNPGGRRLEVLDIPEVEGVEMPKPHDFLSAEQRDGSTLQASEIYGETWEWLKKIGCASFGRRSRALRSAFFKACSAAPCLTCAAVSDIMKKVISLTFRLRAS